MLRNPIPNFPLLQNLRHYINDITATNSTKLFLIVMSEIIIQCLEFSGFFLTWSIFNYGNLSKMKVIQP